MGREGALGKSLSLLNCLPLEQIVAKANPIPPASRDYEKWVAGGVGRRGNTSMLHAIFKYESTNRYVIPSLLHAMGEERDNIMGSKDFNNLPQERVTDKSGLQDKNSEPSFSWPP